MLIAHRRPGAARNRGCRRRFRGRARLHRLGSPTRLLTGRPRVLIRSTRAGARFPDCGSRIRSSERSAPDIWGAPSTGRRSPDQATSSSKTSVSVQQFSKPGQRECRAPSTTGTPASTSTPPQWRPSKRMIDIHIRARDRRDSYRRGAGGSPRTGAGIDVDRDIIGVVEGLQHALVGVGAEENPDGVSPLGQEDSVMPRLVNEMRKSRTGF